MKWRVPLSVLGIEVASSTDVGCDRGDIPCSQHVKGDRPACFWTNNTISRSVVLMRKIDSPFPGQHDIHQHGPQPRIISEANTYLVARRHECRIRKPSPAWRYCRGEILEGKCPKGSSKAAVLPCTIPLLCTQSRLIDNHTSCAIGRARQPVRLHFPRKGTKEAVIAPRFRRFRRVHPTVLFLLSTA